MNHCKIDTVMNDIVTFLQRSPTHSYTIGTGNYNDFTRCKNRSTVHQALKRLLENRILICSETGQYREHSLSSQYYKGDDWKMIFAVEPQSRMSGKALALEIAFGDIANLTKALEHANTRAEELAEERDALLGALRDVTEVLPIMITLIPNTKDGKEVKKLINHLLKEADTFLK